MRVATGDQREPVVTEVILSRPKGADGEEMMKLEKAITMAKEYAEGWGISWSGDLRVLHTYSWWQILEKDHVFEIVAEHGRIIAHVWGKKLYRLEFYPIGPDYDMLPLWAAYPGTNSVTSAWRQSNGEQYKLKWHAWFNGLSPEAKMGYRLKYPEPANPALSWAGFYDDAQAAEPRLI